MTTTSPSLEDVSLWVQYKRRVWNTETPQANTVHNIVRTIRAIHYPTGFAYVSAPVTTGRHLYYLRQHFPQLSDTERIERAISYNYSLGYNLLQSLLGRTELPILFAGDLTPIYEVWEQDHFQALWLSLIAEKCSEIHMAEGWQYSNGGCEELTHVFQLRLGLPRSEGELDYFNTKETDEAARARMRSIGVFDRLGQEITIDDAIAAIWNAIEDIELRGFEAPKIRHCIELLTITRDMIAADFYQ